MAEYTTADSVCTIPKPLETEEIDGELWGTLLARARHAYKNGDYRVHPMRHPDDLLYQILRHLNPSVVMRLDRGYYLMMHRDNYALRCWFLDVIKTRSFARTKGRGVWDNSSLSTPQGMNTLREIGLDVLHVTSDVLRRMERSKVYGDGRQWRMLGVLVGCMSAVVVIAGLMVKSSSDTREKAPSDRSGQGNTTTASVKDPEP